MILFAASSPDCNVATLNHLKPKPDSFLWENLTTSQQVPVCADSSSPRREQLRRVDKGLTIVDVSADDDKVAADLHQN